jgi:RHS repeat-associated protein
VISQFDYTYNANGDILTWTQANSGQPNAHRFDFGYDAADQLRSAALTDTSTGAAVNQCAYDFDPSGNRTNTQNGSTIISSAANNLNQLTAQTSGGKMHFRGTVNEPATVAVAGNPATVDSTGHFDGVADVNVGANTVTVAATDASGNTRTNNYQISVPSGTSTSLLYDLNGNLTSDGTMTYEWDAANRLIAINYSETANRTEFSYDGLGRRVQLVEKSGAAVTGTKIFVWCGYELCEERNVDGAVTKRFYPQGVQIAGTSYYNTRDHLGSIRELTDDAGTVRVRYDYDPFGRRTKVNGDIDSDFGFTGQYCHVPSGLALTLYRAYDPSRGRWISRDPIEEGGGLNLYVYVANSPVRNIDTYGLEVTCTDWVEVSRRFLYYGDDQEMPVGEVNRKFSYVYMEIAIRRGPQIFKYTKWIAVFGHNVWWIYDLSQEFQRYRDNTVAVKKARACRDSCDNNSWIETDTEPEKQREIIGNYTKHWEEKVFKGFVPAGP